MAVVSDTGRWCGLLEPDDGDEEPAEAEAAGAPGLPWLDNVRMRAYFAGDCAPSFVHRSCTPSLPIAGTGPCSLSISASRTTGDALPLPPAYLPRRAPSDMSELTRERAAGVLPNVPYPGPCLPFPGLSNAPGTRGGEK